MSAQGIKAKRVNAAVNAGAAPKTMQGRISPLPEPPATAPLLCAIRKQEARESGAASPPPGRPQGLTRPCAPQKPGGPSVIASAAKTVPGPRPNARRPDAQPAQTGQRRRKSRRPRRPEVLRRLTCPCTPQKPGGPTVIASAAKTVPGPRPNARRPDAQPAQTGQRRRKAEGPAARRSSGG